MEKINLPFFYQLGAQLNPLTKFTPEVNNRASIWLASFPVHTYVYTLLTSFVPLTVCHDTGVELTKAIVEMQRWMSETPPDKWGEIDPSADAHFSNVITKAKEFEIILSAELQRLAVYQAMPKGNYSTTGLIEQAENILPESIRNKMNLNIVEEIQHSGRCLVFDNSTASGFHILRATELVMHEYYLAVCKPKPEPAGRLESWGAYLAELKKSTDPDVQKVVTLLKQIKDDDRNLIMHPERVLSPDDAFILFEIAKSAIIAMGDKLPEGNKK